MTPEIEGLKRLWTHADKDMQRQGEELALTLGFEVPDSWMGGARV